MKAFQQTYEEKQTDSYLVEMSLILTGFPHCILAYKYIVISIIVPNYPDIFKTQTNTQTIRAVLHKMSTYTSFH